MGKVEKSVSPKVSGNCSHTFSLLFALKFINLFYICVHLNFHRNILENCSGNVSAQPGSTWPGPARLGSSRPGPARLGWARPSLARLGARLVPAPCVRAICSRPLGFKMIPSHTVHNSWSIFFFPKDLMIHCKNFSFRDSFKK